MKTTLFILLTIMAVIAIALGVCVLAMFVRMWRDW